jgi:hypothetical protein
MALVRGVGANHPCPRCLIHGNHLGDPLQTAALRTVAQTKAILEEARAERYAKDKEKILKDAGLRNVDVRPRLPISILYSR